MFRCCFVSSLERNYFTGKWIVDQTLVTIFKNDYILDFGHPSKDQEISEWKSKLQETKGILNILGQSEIPNSLQMNLPKTIRNKPPNMSKDDQYAESIQNYLKEIKDLISKEKDYRDDHDGLCEDYLVMFFHKFLLSKEQKKSNALRQEIAMLRHGGEPLEGVGAAVGQGVAILRKANERRTSRNFGGSGGRGGGFQSRTNNNHHHSNNNLGGTNNYSNRSHSTCIPRQYGP